MQYLLRHSKEEIHSKEGILLLLSFLESSHLLHYYMDGVFTHYPLGLFEIKYIINTLFVIKIGGL